MKSGENILERRSLSFFYLSESNIPEYKEKVKDYLTKEAENIKKIGFGHLITELYDFDKRKNKLPTGHIYILDLEDKENKFEEVCEYILSKDRKFIPKGVKCKNKEDYSMIEKILKENYGEKGKLKNYFWMFGKKIQNK